MPAIKPTHTPMPTLMRTTTAFGDGCRTRRPSLVGLTRLTRLTSLAGLAVAVALVLAGCAGVAPAPAPTHLTTWPARLQTLLPADVLLLGEQHDAADHQRLQRNAVRALAERGQLAAVVLEMAESGHSTRRLPLNATEQQAQAALNWSDHAWPWAAYGPVVMAAVAAGVPVLGGNLPRSQMRIAMAETKWDQHLPPAALQRQYDALRDGHCGLLPQAQVAPMTRIQIARDASMARIAQEALRPGQTVLLIAGAGHVLRSVGVPTHWPATVVSKVVLAQSLPSPEAISSGAIGGANDRADTDAVIATPALPPHDACAALRQQWRPTPTPQSGGLAAARGPGVAQ